MSALPSGVEAAELLREGRGVCSPWCGRLVDVAYWCETGNGCFCGWSCLLHWPADMSGHSNRGEYAYWHDGRWLTVGWIDWHGHDMLAEFDHVTQDIVHMAADALLVELESGGWRVRTPEDREQRATMLQTHRPDGRTPAVGSWWWLTQVVLVGPPSGVIATTSFGWEPG